MRILYAESAFYKKENNRQNRVEFFSLTIADLILLLRAAACPDGVLDEKLNAVALDLWTTSSHLTGAAAAFEAFNIASRVDFPDDKRAKSFKVNPAYRKILERFKRNVRLELADPTAELEFVLVPPQHVRKPRPPKPSMKTVTAFVEWGGERVSAADAVDLDGYTEPTMEEAEEAEEEELRDEAPKESVVIGEDGDGEIILHEFLS